MQYAVGCRPLPAPSKSPEMPSHAASTGGVTVSIRKGSTVLWQQALTTSASLQCDHDRHGGSSHRLHINRGADGNWNYDTTVFDPTITLTTGGTPPPPSTRRKRLCDSDMERQHGIGSLRLPGFLWYECTPTTPTRSAWGKSHQRPLAVLRRGRSIILP